MIGEHLQKPRNAGSRPEAQFFNTLANAAADYNGKERRPQ
jgi:hypothetical protein